MKSAAFLSLLVLVPFIGLANCFRSERQLSTSEGSFRGARLVTDYETGKPANDEMTQVFVRYHDEDTKLEVLAAAEELIEDDENGNLVVKMREDKYEQVKRNKLAQVEIDNKVEAYVDQHEHVPLHSGQRILDEEIPWGIKMIQADQLDVGAHALTVCLIDTGYAQGHPDLPNDTTGTSTPDRNFTWNEDLNGHGTHIAGVVAAVGGNGRGVTGAGNIKLHIARGLDQYSAGYESDVRRGVRQCVTAGAKIISISLGSPVMSNTARDLYTQVVEQEGVMIVAAAGNQGTNGKAIDAFPASHPSVISVAAVYEWGSYWEGSNFCDQVELAAPGHRILSTSVSTSAVHTSAFSYPGQRVSGAPVYDVRGTLVNCGPGNRVCNEAAGGICLMVRDATSLEQMISNCQAGGGNGVVIFDAVQGSNRMRYQNWRGDASIPAVGVQHLAGLELLEQVNSFVELGLSRGDDREYSYSYMSGTSMATPHVAAAAALVWSHFPECTNHQIRHALAVTAQDQGIPGCDYDYGYGIVKAKDAYNFLLANPCTQGDWWQPTGDTTPVCEWTFPDVVATSTGADGQQSVGESNNNSPAQNLIPELVTKTPDESTQTSSARLVGISYLSLGITTVTLFATRWIL